MISINQTLIDVSQIYLEGLSAQQLNILNLMEKSREVYRYDSMMQLEFELLLREEIIEAAKLLDRSGAQFASFETSKCNERYWTVTGEGGFELRPNVLPQTAIEDIFINGQKYAFECAVAIVIIYYKAVLESIDKRHFNQMFANLYLFSWKFDLDLDLNSHIGTDFLPGDCVYFKNSDHDLRMPEWQGENAIVLNGNLYFGHGIGVTTSQGIINVLNTKRKKDSKISAFLLNQITRPNFRYLSQFRITRSRVSPLAIFKIGSKTYLL